MNRYPARSIYMPYAFQEEVERFWEKNGMRKNLSLVVRQLLDWYMRNYPVSDRIVAGALDDVLEEIYRERIKELARRVQVSVRTVEASTDDFDDIEALEAEIRQAVDEGRLEPSSDEHQILADLEKIGAAYAAKKKEERQ